MLFTVAGLFTLYEAYHKYHEIHEAHGHPDDSILTSRWWWVPLVVLGIAIVLESFSFRTAIIETNKTRVTRRTGPSSGGPSRPSCR